MTSFKADQQSFSNLKGKVVVLTGGSNGIGLEVVKIYASQGAHVVFGDIDAARGTALADSISQNTPQFLSTDVTSYSSILALFEKAFSMYNRVDIAISNAGIVERPGWFEPTLTLETVKEAPSTAVLDINLRGTLFFSRIAAVYLRQNAAKSDDKALILLSSVAGFEASPGLFVYQATKHGVIGLMRSLRGYLSTAYDEVPIRVNCVCPWATSTAMISTFESGWQKEGLPLNTPADVAEVIVGLSADKTLNGESIYVEGGRGWAFEANLQKLQPQWLGQSAAENLAKGQEFLGSGSKWTE